MRCPKAVLGVFISALLLLSADARAAAPDVQAEAQARKLYDEAKRAMVDGDFEHACPRLEAAKALLPDHINTGILLAECYQDGRKLASAAAELSRIKALAEYQRRPEKVADIERRIAALEPRIPTLSIVVPPAIAELSGLSITRAGTPVPPNAWDKPTPVDFGKFEITAVATSKTVWSTRVEIEKEGERVEVRIEPPWTSAPTTEPAAPPPSTSWPRPVSFVAMGLGAAGLGVGAVLGAMALARNGESNDGLCDARQHCNQAGFDLRKQAQTLGNGSTAAIVAGGVLLAGGVTLFALAPRPPKDDENTKSAKVSVEIGLGSLGVRGSW